MNLHHRPRVPAGKFLFIFLVVVLSILASGWFYFDNQRLEIEQRIYEELSGIAELKINQIMDWKKEQMSRAMTIHRNPFIPSHVRRFFEDPSEKGLQNNLLSWMESIYDDRDYRDLYLVNKKGDLRLALHSDRERLHAETDSLIQHAGRSRDVHFSDLHKDEEGMISIWMIIPLLEQKLLLGFLVAEIDPFKYLYPLIQYWPSQSSTSETMIVRPMNDEVLVLNDLRHRPGAALDLCLPMHETSLPSAMAVSGREGVFEGTDYRGVPVLTSMQGIPGLPWSLVSKVDRKEIFSPIRRHAMQVSLVSFLLILTALSLLTMAWKQQHARYYRMLYESEQDRSALGRHIEQITKYANDIILLMNQEGKIVNANNRALSAYGYTTDEMLTLNIGDLRAPQVREEAAACLQGGKDEKGILFETLHQRKDGTIFPIEISARYMEMEGKRYYQTIGRDITDRKQLQEQVNQMQQLESIGTLAGGVAHDFNNLLTVIQGHAEISLFHLEKDHPCYTDIRAIQTAARRAGNLTSQLLAFSRRQIHAPEVLDLNPLLTDLEGMLRRLIGEDIQLQTSLAPDIPRIKADPVQIEQIVMNLIVNARDAIHDRLDSGADRLITIETGRVRLDASYAARHAEIGTGLHLLLSVSDTGAGMSEETEKRIFEPFFTTKEKGKGTGLGLSTVYGIVKQNNGSIYVYSEPDQGTTFKIYWPATREEASPGAPGKTIQDAPRGKETILLVEDDEGVRQLAVKSLRSLGYTVYEAANGKQALQWLREKQIAPDLLLTDLVMPGMNGRELAEEVTRILPSIHVLFASGYTDNHIVHRGVLKQGTQFIQKPFTFRALARKVWEVLDS